MNDTNKDIELKLQTAQTRQLFIKIEIIDTNNKVINEVSGSSISGQYNIDGSSSVRRTCSVTFNLEKGYLPTDTDSVFWLNKKFKLYVGLKIFNTDELYWFDKGTYAIKDPSINISISDKTISINGLDKMALYNGDIGGQLPYSTLIEVGQGTETPYAHEAIQSIMRGGGETKLFITKTDLQIPYKIESSIGDTRWDLVNKIVELFYDYQAYYNVDGYFVFDKKPSYRSNNNVDNTIAMNFSKNYRNTKIHNTPYNLIISLQREIDYGNVKNKIVVYGGVHDDGYQPSAEIIVNDENYADSPYTVEKLHETYSDNSPMYRTYVVQDDTYVDAVTNFVLYNSTLNNEMRFVYKQCVKYNDAYYKCISVDGSNNIEPPDTNTKDWELICTTFQLENSRDNGATLFNVSNSYSKGDIVYTTADTTNNIKNYYLCLQDCNGGVSISDTSYWMSIKRLSEYMTDIHSYSNSLCKKRAEQEVYLHQQATDKVTITCVPIYSLDVNEVIYLDDAESGVVGEYVINNISCGLGAGDTMSITANKLW